MATAHSLSMITSSSVKPPINPKTGLYSTVNERFQKPENMYLEGKDEDFDSDQENVPQNQISAANGLFFNKTESMLHDITSADLANLTDEDFYKKLSELREEHKKTLQICEKMYTEKLGRGGGWTDLDASHHGILNGTGNQNDSRMFNTSDNVLDMSASYKKPPTGKPTQSQGQPQRTNSRFNAGRHSGDPEDYWKPISTATSDNENSDDEIKHKKFNNSLERNGYLNDSTASALDKIEQMWKNFNIEEYAPRTHPRSGSVSQMSTSSSPNLSKSSEWRHRITIPEPFTMTLREETKEKTKSRTLEEFERLKQEKQQKEEEEIQKKFKATPVPAHVYMPLFDNIMEKQEMNRALIKHKSQDLLQTIQKPFKFTLREEEEKERRREERKKYLSDEMNGKKTFKARPVPSHIFDENIDEKIAEEEEYRRIRVQMRAEELLRSSSLPPNMKARGEDYFKGRSRQKSRVESAKKRTLSGSGTMFKPKINEDVPDFEEIHRQFAIEMSNRKYAKEATVCKPFKLRTSRKAQEKKHKVYEDINRDRETLRSNRWDFGGTKSSNLRTMSFASSSMDSIPTKMTQTAELRKSALQKKIQERIENEMMKMDTERRRRRREKELRRVVSERAAVNDLKTTMQHQSKEKMREFKNSERARQEEYQRHLREMQDRLGQRPLLFERTTQSNAKRKAEKHYMETLQRAGLDLDFITKKGSSAGITEDLSDDEGYSKHSRQPYSRQSSARSNVTGSARSNATYSARSNATKSGSRTRTHSVSDKKYSQDFDDSSDGEKTNDDVSDVEQD